MAINENMIVYKNKEEKKPQIINRTNYLNNDYYESSILLDLHTGTHIDAPLHMINNGSDINNYPLESFFSLAQVLDFTNCSNNISQEDLESKKINKDSFVLLKTRNSYQDYFDFNFIYLDENGANYLKEIGVKGVGIDALGIERNQEGHPTHKILLQKQIIILEGLNLKDVPEDTYYLIAFPLKIDNVEASPTRAILIKTNNEIN